MRRFGLVRIRSGRAITPSIVNGSKMDGCHGWQTVNARWPNLSWERESGKYQNA